MKSDRGIISCQIELRPGEKLVLPDEIQQQVGPGSWVVTIRPADDGEQAALIRDHRAFLNGYVPEDEGLYDGNVAR
jgi:hypothetical protein